MAEREASLRRNNRVRSRRALLGANHRGRVWEPFQGSHYDEQVRHCVQECLNEVCKANLRSIARWLSDYPEGSATIGDDLLKVVPNRIDAEVSNCARTHKVAQNYVRLCLHCQRARNCGRASVCEALPKLRSLSRLANTKWRNLMGLARVQEVRWRKISIKRIDWVLSLIVANSNPSYSNSPTALSPLAVTSRTALGIPPTV